MSVTLAPPPFQYLPNNNNSGSPAVGFKLFTYIAGTSTKQATWVDSTQTTQNANPILLDANGFIAAASGEGLWIDPSLSYKFVLALPTDTDPPASPLRTQDNVQGYFSLAALTAGLIGSILYPTTAAETAASVTPSAFQYPPFDLRRYGADPTGVSASDTAMTNAIAVCGVTGGTIQLVGTTFLFNNQISLNQKRSIIFQGQGGLTNGSAPTTSMVYAGTTGPFIAMTSAYGCEIRDCEIKFTNVSFSNTLLKASNDGTHGDTFLCGVRRCTFGNDISQRCVHIDLDKTVNFTADKCYFFAGTASITGQAAAGGSYSNTVTIRDSYFQNCTSGPIRFAGENWTIQGCSFEPLNGGAAGAFSTVSAAPVKQLTWINNWLGDVSASGGTWITVWGTGVNIIGNRFGGFATATNAIELDTVKGCIIQGNRFDTFSGVLNFADANSNGVVFQGNELVTVTNVFITGSNAPGNLVFNPNDPVVAPPASVKFGNIATPGYEVSPNGVIRMWGVKTVTAGTPLAITFATEVGLSGGFPTACFQADCWFGAAPGASATGTYTSSTSATGTTLNVAGGTASNTVNWQAIGN